MAHRDVPVPPHLVNDPIVLFALLSRAVQAGDAAETSRLTVALARAGFEVVARPPAAVRLLPRQVRLRRTGAPA